MKKKARLPMRKFLFFIFLVVGVALFADEEVEKASSFTLKSMDNKTVCLDSLRGHYVIVDFWAIYCKSCVEGLDAMKDIYKTYKDRGLVYLAINEDGPRNISKVPGFVKGHQWEYTILYDPKQEVQQLYGIQAIPETFIIDIEGNIILRHRGYKKGEEKEIEKKLSEILPEAGGDDGKEEN